MRRIHDIIDLIQGGTLGVTFVFILVLCILLLITAPAYGQDNTLMQEVGYEVHMGFPADLGTTGFGEMPALYGLTIDWHVIPKAGLAVNLEISDYVFYVGAGFTWYPINDHEHNWSLVITAQLGYFQQTYDVLPKMGSNWMFKENIELRIPLIDHLQVTVGVYHWSNAGIGSVNPGVEILYFGIRMYGP